MLKQLSPNASMLKSGLNIILNSKVTLEKNIFGNSVVCAMEKCKVLKYQVKVKEKNCANHKKGRVKRSQKYQKIR